MTRRNQLTWLEETRLKVAQTIRKQRLQRAWTQAELAQKLGISQNRLSELERERGSFSAEQLLLVARLFNLSLSDFSTEHPTAESELQNALVRWGATDLNETLLLPSAQLEDLGVLIREVLVDATPRLIGALAPVVVRNAARIHFSRIQGELTAAGFPRRLPWALENIVVAVDYVWSEVPDTIRRTLTNTVRMLRLFLESVASLADPKSELDVIDRWLRTTKTVSATHLNSSDISKRWRVVTSLAPDDFARSLRGSLGPA